MGKARVAETFLASKLVHAMKFYPIPLNLRKDIQNSIFSFVNFPNKVVTVGQREMWKVKHNGGLKLVNVQIKSETSKAKWLTEMASDPNCKVHLQIFNDLMGHQKGNNTGKDMIFMHTPHITRVMKIDNPFYKEALKSISIFNLKKGIENINLWDEENIFYNPLIMNATGQTIKETNYFSIKGIYKLGQLLGERGKEARNQPFDNRATALLNNIILDTNVKKEDTFFLANSKEVKMSVITQKELYEEAIYRLYSTDHVHQTKWVERLDNIILWEEVWDSVHNFLSSNTTKTAIWEQIHLNYYTQHSYNKWHGVNDLCPLCDQEVESIYHIILDCEFVNALWMEIDPILLQLHRKHVTDEEKSLGIIHIKKTAGMIMRNWLTYKMRFEIMQYERAAYHSKNSSLYIFKAKFNQSVASEIKQLLFRFYNDNKLEEFDKIVAFKNVLCEKVNDGEYRFNRVF